MKQTLAALFASAMTLAATTAFAADPNPAKWDEVLAQAKGQTVYFNAWGGSQNINDYITWAGSELQARYGVNVEHVKLDDTASAVATVIAEKTAGKTEGGRVDLIWINGENFASMKDKALLYTTPDGDGWATKLPNWALVDVENKPTITVDFTIPTDGLESPWGGAKMVFFHDTAREKIGDLPDSIRGLAGWAMKNPGRFSYPAPPDFIGSSFLKQALSELVGDPDVLQQPVVDAEFEDVTAPLFNYLDGLHPNLWRSGRAFVKNYPAMVQGLADGELDIIFAFNPAEASSAIAQDRLPDTIRSFTFSGGTLGNTHFVAIPFNANAKAGALVLANFLLSPEAQARKQDPTIWGDPTVLNVDKLAADDKAKFAALDLGIATLKPEELGPMLPEPHPSWMAAIEKEWAKRYATGNN
ncbi:ABC transporter substrate-binding protein [Ahrensia sp. R2A130]|uniref:ABC transporter substrate-binding protein n=1 Tax=Ahrensia sp. R2A130 TaxID=744979 RepID=UPI0001E0F0AB|nr:ABC transporter substrate-binding protein [Ahrensia sp. R2A130]EFL89914.1 protein YnjB [Ahrensia sp. R2A130]